MEEVIRAIKGGNAKGERMCLENLAAKLKGKAAKSTVHKYLHRLEHDGKIVTKLVMDGGRIFKCLYVPEYAGKCAEEKIDEILETFDAALRAAREIRDPADTADGALFPNA